MAAKVHPHPSSDDESSSSSSSSFTVWVKSLVFHGKGCTVFNSKGEVAFGVDNYQRICSRKAFLMDSAGSLLFSFTRKKKVGGVCWEGLDSEVRMERAWFEVRRNKQSCWKVALIGSHQNTCYTITGFIQGKSPLRITDPSAHILAEATEKQSSEGIPLGDDVLRLAVEERADQSLVHALINSKLQTSLLFNNIYKILHHSQMLITLTHLPRK